MKSLEYFHHEKIIDIQLSKYTDKYGGNVFHLYSDLNKLKNYLTDISPEDAPIINKFINRVKLLQKFDLPPINKKQPWYKYYNIIFKLKYLRLLPIVINWSKETNVDFSNKFKSNFLKEAFRLLYDDHEVKMFVFALPMAYFDNKSAGCPKGGSNAFVKKLEEKYISLGGKINFNTEVNKIIVENNVVTAINYNNDNIKHSDITLSATDWNLTFNKLLNGSFKNKINDELALLKNYEIFFSTILISFGINKVLNNFSHYLRFPLNEPLVSPDGTEYNRLELKISNFDETLVPKGKSLLSVNLYTKNGEYWINLRKQNLNEYNKVKNDFASKILLQVETQVGEISQHIEMTDVATPATIERYTNSWKGSTQGWLPGKKFINSSVCNYYYKNLDNFYYSSHWNTPGGGLPVVVKNSREVSKIICKRNNQKFVF